MLFLIRVVFIFELWIKKWDTIFNAEGNIYSRKSSSREADGFIFFNSLKWCKANSFIILPFSSRAKALFSAFGTEKTFHNY